MMGKGARQHIWRVLLCDSDLFGKDNRIFRAVELSPTRCLEAIPLVEPQSFEVFLHDDGDNSSEAVLLSPLEYSVHQVNSNPLPSVLGRNPDLQQLSYINLFSNSIQRRDSYCEQNATGRVEGNHEP